MKKQHKPLIGIVSGIGPLAGADVLVAGSTVFKSTDPIATIAALKAL